MGFFDVIKHAAGTIASGAAQAAKTTANGAAQAAKATAHGVDQAEGSVAKAVDPHLAQLEDQYDALRDSYNASRLTLVSDCTKFQGVLADYRSMAACNGALLIAGRVYQWSDSEFNAFLAQTVDAPAFVQAEALPSGVSQLISKSTGSDHVVHFLAAPTDAAGFGLGAIARAMGVGGIGGDGGAAPANVSAALLIGSDIGAAVIGDIIAGEIEYPKEIHALQGMYDQLRARLAKVQAAITALEAGIQHERRAFLDSMGRLAPIQTPTFRWQLSPDDPDSAYQYAMVLAVQQYGIVFRLRTDWTDRYQANVANGSYRQFVLMEQMIGHSARYTAAQVDKIIWLIATSTDGSLHAAWDKAGRPSPS